MGCFPLGKKCKLGGIEMKNNKWQVCICGAIKCENEYLMVKRSLDDEDCAGFWEMPSGKLEFGESVEQGLQREIFEEVGIDINSFQKQIIGISEYSSEKPEGTKYSVQLNYVIEVPTKDLPIKLSEEQRTRNRVLGEKTG